MQGKEAFGMALAILRLLSFDKHRILAGTPHDIPIGELLSRQSVETRFPYINHQNLTGAGVFYDGQIINPPRLVLSIVRSAADAGTKVANYCEITGLGIEGDKVSKAVVLDKLTGNSVEINADLVVNATGPFSSQLLQKLIPSYNGFKLPLSRDMAFVLKKQFDSKFAVALQTLHSDPDSHLSRGNRHIFLVPWHNLTLVGVSSKFYETSPYELQVSEQEIEDFLLEINLALVDEQVNREDILSVYAGLLPCEGQEPGTGNVSYGKRSLIVDHHEDCGLVNLLSTAAVRWTMGRKVAEQTTDKIFSKLSKKSPRCRTFEDPVWGGAITDFNETRRIIDTELAELGCSCDSNRLIRLYGSCTKEVLELAQNDYQLRKSISGSDLIKCEVIHAIRSEMAVSLEDFIQRRSELSDSVEIEHGVLEECSKIFALEFGWDETRRISELLGLQHSGFSNLKASDLTME
jgi:glycerol-3-phosphate dehydrogenase